MLQVQELAAGAELGAGENPTYFKKGLPFRDSLRTFVIKDATRNIAAFEAGQVLICNRISTCSLNVKEFLSSNG